MSITSEHGDRISPSHLDVRFLTALGGGKMNGYQITRQVEDDARDGIRISNGMSQACLRRLVHATLVIKDDDGYYSASNLGKRILNIEIARLAALVKLAKDRL